MNSHHAHLFILLCFIFVFTSCHHKSSGESEYRTSEYRQLKQTLAAGWNTWDTRSVLRHVLLPEGVAVTLMVKDGPSGQTLK
jgi:hypothetical protein